MVVYLPHRQLIDVEAIVRLTSSCSHIPLAITQFMSIYTFLQYFGIFLIFRLIGVEKTSRKATKTTMPTNTNYLVFRILDAAVEKWSLFVLYHSICCYFGKPQLIYSSRQY